MKKIKDTRHLVTAGMFAALTFVATSVIKIPTPVMGYIHIGDGVALLSCYVLGPFIGGLAGGLGSMLSDLLGGYALWAPGTFIIKLAACVISGTLFHKSASLKTKHPAARLILSGIAGESVMVFGYFMYNILMLTAMSSDSAISLSAAVTGSLSEIPFNIAQGIMGIAVSAVLFPIFERVPVINDITYS